MLEILEFLQKFSPQTRLQIILKQIYNLIAISQIPCVEGNKTNHKQQFDDIG